MNKIKPTQKTDYLPDMENNKQPWWKLDRVTWLLMAGLVLMNIAFFISPELLDSVVSLIKRVLDVRRWPWWYFIVLILTGWFAYKWCEYYQGFKDDIYDELDCVYIARYMRMNVVVTFDLWLLVFCHAKGLFPHFYYVMKQWIGYNQYSHLAAFLFLGSIIVGGTTFYVLKDWIVAELGKRGIL